MKKLVFAAVVAFCLVAAPAADRAAAHDGAHDGHANHAPKKSARRAAKARRKTPAQAAAYFSCPMHADVRAKKAGECPKCGMDLVAKRPGVK